MSNKQKPRPRDPGGREAEVVDQAAAKWDAGNAAKKRSAEITRDELADQLDTARKYERDAHSRVRNTPGKVQMNVRRSGDKDIEIAKDIQPKDWNLYDQATALIAVLTGCLLLGLGGVNVATALLNSGIPTFIEHPYAAWMVGMLVPAVSMAVKFGYGLFDHAVNRKRYAWAVYTSAIVSGFVWVVLFALSYEGVSAEIDWGSLGQTTTADQLASLLTIVQIVTEVLAAAALFIVVANVFASYSASYVTDNPELLDAQGTHKDRVAEYQAVLAQFAEADGECERLEAERIVFINQALTNWRSGQADKAQS